MLIAAIHRDWGEAQGNYDEFRFLTGLRPSEQMALVVTDYDAANNLLNVTKARVAGCHRDRTKTNEDRRVVLCRRARAVLERQLTLREQLCREGRMDHDHLFFHADGAPMLGHAEVYGRWRASLKRLAIRYRKPYAARHSSVSWNLMIGKNPLWVARQHGHSVLTMLTVYTAWVQGAREEDVAAIRRALRSPAYASRVASGAHHEATRTASRLRAKATQRRGTAQRREITLACTEVSTDRAEEGFGNRFASSNDRTPVNPLEEQQKRWRSGRDSKS